MSRNGILFSVLGALVLVAAYVFLLHLPKNAEVTELAEQRTALETQATQLQGQINRLREIRAAAPDVEADLAAAESIVPRSASLPVALRQLQLAADDSGVTLLSVSPSRPAAVATDGAPAGLSSIAVGLSVEGGYFQLVDFLRRIEDPVITARAFRWVSVSITPGDYPTLAMSLSGQMFAVLEEVAP